MEFFKNRYKIISGTHNIYINTYVYIHEYPKIQNLKEEITKTSLLWIPESAYSTKKRRKKSVKDDEEEEEESTHISHILDYLFCENFCKKWQPNHNAQSISQKK